MSIEKEMIAENTWAPVVVFAYNRLGHLQECLRALEKAQGAVFSKLYIFSDGFKGDEDKKKVTDVQEYLHKYEGNSLFSSVYVTYSKDNKGLAESVIAGVGKIIRQYGKVIVVEDDLIVAPDFLVYMNLALKHYEKDQRVWQIGGWSYDIAVMDNLKEDTYLWYRSNSWGWGTWADRWEMVDWNLQDYKEFKFSFSKRHKMNRGGADMANMLDMQMEGEIDSWSIRFAYVESMNNMLTVFPRQSRVVNCGRDGSGTNCHAIKEVKGNSKNDMIDKLMKLQCNINGYLWGEQLVCKKIRRKLYFYYSGDWLTCLKRIVKSVIYRLKIKNML